MKKFLQTSLVLSALPVSTMINSSAMSLAEFRQLAIFFSSSFVIMHKEIVCAIFYPSEKEYEIAGDSLIFFFICFMLFITVSFNGVPRLNAFSYASIDSLHF